MAKIDEREHVTVASNPDGPTFEWPRPKTVERLIIDGSIISRAVARARASGFVQDIKVTDGGIDSDRLMLWGLDEHGDVSGVERGESTNRTEQAYANYKKLVGRVIDVFGDEIVASTWLSTANADFGDKPPLQVAQEHGYDPDILESVLVRIEHGVYF